MRRVSEGSAKGKISTGDPSASPQGDKGEIRVTKEKIG